MSRASRILFVSGLSGSGKSTAMAALEDLGFYCVDNLPPQLIDQFLALCEQVGPSIDKIALAVDTREAHFLTAVPGALARLREAGRPAELIFLDCSDEDLVNRYRETRRVHPLAPHGRVEDGIEQERRLLVDLARLADHRIDSSDLNIHELKAEIRRRLSGEARSLVLNLISFGFRFPTPASAELLFDVRFLPNPYFDPRFRARSGLDPEVAAHVLHSERGEQFLGRLLDLLDFLLPLYDAEGRAYLTVGIGCTGGRHRSVSVCEAVARTLRARGREVNVEHRDVEKSE